MREALALAREAGNTGDVPVGAIVVHDGGAVSGASNRTVRDRDATAHAEVLAIRGACAALGRERLERCTMYVTLEPCAMCAGALVLARMGAVVFGAWDAKAGMSGSVEDLLRHPRLNHRPEVTGGVLAAESAQLLREFFGRRWFVDSVSPPG